MPWNPEHYKNISWNTGLAAERARHNLKLKKNKKIKKKVSAQARKRSSLTGLKL
jgi:hypothetical protein